MVESFVWHEVSDKEREKIRRDSKKLLNEFASKISKIKASDEHFENESGVRDEGGGWNTDEDFRSITISNAPFVEDDSIVAEKGGWK